MNCNGDEEINYDEFIASMIDSKKSITKDRLWVAFKHFSIDQSDHISIGSLKEAMARSGREIPESELKEMLDEVDIDKTGQITFDQFCALFTSKTELEWILFSPADNEL
jgi:calcium-dependent protein kinase